MRAHVLLVLGAFLVGTGAAEAKPAEGRVLFGELQAKGVSPGLAARATRSLRDAMRSLEGLTVLGFKERGRRKLSEVSKQLDACRRDAICLAELGGLSSADLVVVGTVGASASQGPAPSEDETLALDLLVVEVESSKAWSSIQWSVSQGGLEAAATFAARVLLRDRDASLLLELEPPEATLLVFGSEVPKAGPNGLIPFWSGTFRVSVSAPGFVSRSFDVQAEPEALTRIAARLDTDPLFVAPSVHGAEADAKGNRVVGVREPEVGSSPATSGGPGLFGNPWPWMATGLGLGATVVGGLIMKGAQARYNEMSAQPRHSPGVTSSAAAAASIRDEARSDHGLGGTVLVSGLVITAVAATWLVLDLVVWRDEG